MLISELYEELIVDARRRKLGVLLANDVIAIYELF